MGGSPDPNNPDEFRNALGAADQQPEGDVGQVCATCPNNWVETGAIDETSGEPLPGLGYRVYDLVTGDKVVSGILDAEGKSARHDIPMPCEQLYAVFGTEEAMDEAEESIDEIRREHALQANARADWQGIPAGLDQEGFNRAFDVKAETEGRTPQTSSGFFNSAGQGAQRVWKHLTSDWDTAEREFYQDERARAFDEYLLATNARSASKGESLGGGTGQGLSFSWGDEIVSKFESVVTGRSYDDIVADRRQIMEAQRIANPGYFMAGEIAGAVPTIFVPVGGAAANAARAGRGAAGALRSGGLTGAGLGAVSGAGQDQGGFVDRLDGAAVGALTGGAAGAVMGGTGVLIARGISRTRIWARITGRPRPGSLDNKAAREWYLEQERLIPERLDPNAPLEAQARQAHALRNEARTMARDLMADRDLAAQLARDNPNLSWNDIVARTQGKGFQGDDMLREIISSSQRSRTSVNQKLGL